MKMPDRTLFVDSIGRLLIKIDYSVYMMDGFTHIDYKLRWLFDI